MTSRRDDAEHADLEGRDAVEIVSEGAAPEAGTCDRAVVAWHCEGRLAHASVPLAVR